MDQFDVYKNNIDLKDNYSIKNIQINKSFIFNGDYQIFKQTDNSEEGNKSKPLAATVLGINNTDIPLPDDVEFLNCWTDADAQEAYLKQGPKTYMILGKQGTGCYSVGEALAKKLNCIHICPKNVLIDEIEQKSLSGKCLEFNMRHNKVCKFDIIMTIMKEKLKSPAVAHRGFVISGLPMVTSIDGNLYFSDTLISEEALDISQDILNDLVYSFKKKKSKKVISSHSSVSSKPDSSVEEEEVEEEQEIENETVADQEEELIIELPKFYLNTCKDLTFHTTPNYKTLSVILLNQIQDIFNFKPDIIFSVSCPNKDVITKRGCKYINYLNNYNTFKPFECYVDNEIKWPPHYTLIDFVKPYDTHTFNPKYNCKQPNNFSAVVTQQLCNFKACLTPFIEKKLKSYNSKDIIKLDGRVSVHQMSYICFERLLLMSIKPVLIPEPLYLDDPPEDFEELWRLIEQLNVLHSGVLSFNRYASFWYNRCPVELKKRRSINGNAKFAVTFFKHVYLLSSLQAMIDFCRNPRPFLKLEYLEPTCRVIVMGTQSSGKTMIAKCLSWLFAAPIISYDSFSEEIKNKKHLNYSKNILIEIRSNIEDARFNEWQNHELERTSKLNTWFNTVSSRLAAYIPLLKKKLALQEDETFEDRALLNKFDSLKNQLDFLPISDLDTCKEMARNNNLLQFAPPELTTQLAKPDIPLLGDEDVTRAIASYIAANELEKEIEPTVSEFISELVTILQSIDNNSLNSSENIYGKFIIDGFPCDSEYWISLSESGFLPDYTIALIENREIDEDLLQYYINLEKCPKNHQERFSLADDPLIKVKLLQGKLSNAWPDMQIIVEQLITDVFRLLFESDETVVTEANNEASMSEKIEKFRENWDIIKLQLERNLKSTIDVELEDKSDIDVIEEVLQKIRKGYGKPLEIEEEASDLREDESESAEDVSYNDPHYLGETNIYCPVAFYDYGILWEGKNDFVSKYFNKYYYSCNENSFKSLQNDITKYQCYNKPSKKIPPLRICVVGSIGSGKSTLSKIIAKELGLFHIDFDKFINSILIPKHFKRVGWQYENSFTDTVDADEEEVDDLQPEEMNSGDMSDVLFKEKEITKMVKNYFEQGSSLPSVFIARLIKKLWFESPYIESGVVIDGFPKLSSDVEDMISNYCIPDIIIELECDPEIAIERLSSQLYKKWKLQLKEAKAKVDKALEVERNEWKNFITRKIVIELIIHEVLEGVVINFDEPLKSASAQSTIIDADPTGSSNVDAYLFAIYNELIQEYPEPVDVTEWEKSEDALERINNRIENIYQVQDENIQNLKDVIYEQKLKMESFNGRKRINIIIRRVLEKISKLRNRGESFLEQTFTINCDIAEILILEGFFLLSKFNRMCPVFIRDNPCSLFNPYNVNKLNNSVFPVIHRAYIYFISSKDNVRKFRKNPWEYLKEDIIKLYTPYPLSISVIGAPKSGKSKLASKLAKRYGLICISRGMAIRYIMENMRWTRLGLKVSSLLHEGQCINSKFIMKAVITVAMVDNRTMSNGVILDGIPDSPFEACELSKHGLFPLVVFDIKSTKQTVLKNSQNEIYNDILKIKPPYCSPLINVKFLNWEKNSKLVRNWINEDTQNLYDINGNNSKWQCYSDATNVVEELIPKVHHYLTYEKSKIVRVGFMAVSNKTFEQKMSCFKNLCPVCFKKNTLRHSGFPPDKKGLVQYMDYLYWLCSDHIDLALKFPEQILATKKIIIPEIPAPVTFVDMSIVYENGICIVTYAENLPSQKILKGLNQFSALYKKKMYLFCSSTCHLKFLSKPHIYYDIKVFKELNMFPKLTLKEMPHLGYLEQSIGNVITEACCAINAARPKYPGLNIRLSALLYLALFLKTHNNLLEREFVSAYKRIFKIFEARCKLITDISLRLRSTSNPFAVYPDCCKNNKLKQLEGNTRKSDSAITTIYSDADFTRRVPVPDERYDFLCEYHKPVSKVPAFLNVVDIAGLVRGAAEGQGLGNAFLSHIKACDAIFNLCRAFDDESVIHVDGEVDPIRDLETIGEELRLKDEEQLMQNIEKLDRVVNRGGDKKLKPEYEALAKIKTIIVEEKKHIRFGDWSAADIEVLNKYLFLTSKPALYLVNLSEKDYIRKKNKWLPKLKEWIDKNDPGAPLIPFSGALESKLLDMEPEERKQYLKENNITSALDKIIVQGYKALQLEYFFTAGPDEVKAWTIQKGTKAPQAAGRIHTDFEKGFIMAEVMHYKDFKEEGSEAACKGAGKYRQQGRNYVVEDGDIIFFKFNAGAGLKDAKKK